VAARLVARSSLGRRERYDGGMRLRGVAALIIGIPALGCARNRNEQDAVASRHASPCTTRSRGYDSLMGASVTVHIDLEVPTELGRLRVPESVDRGLQTWLDKQDRAQPLTADERAEAEGLVELAELLTLLRLRAERNASSAPSTSR